MTPDQLFVLVVLLGAVTLFVTEVFPVGVTGLCIIAVLGLSPSMDPTAVLEAFSSPALVLVGSLYVVSSSLIRTGVVAAFGERLVRLGGDSELRLVIVATLVAVLASTLLNNTSIVVLMLPILLGAAGRIGVPPSRLLIPLSYAAILGGTMTLIGTSTNVLVADLARRELDIRFFDFLPVGIGFAGTGMLYLWTFGRRLLPSRPTVSSVTRGRAFEYVTELEVPESSPAAGLRPAELARRAGGNTRFLQLVRGEEILDQDATGAELRPGDVLVLRGVPNAIVSLRRDFRLEPLPGMVDSDEDVPRRGTTFAEIVITPGSDLLGRTLEEVGLHRSYGVLALALQRRGEHLRRGITKVPLRTGDVILVQGAPENVEGLRGQLGFLLLIGVDEAVHVRRRAPVAVGILVLFVVLATMRTFHLSLLAVAAATACFVTGCSSLRGAARDVDWNVLGLLAGAIALGAALDHTGLAKLLAHGVVGMASQLGPYAVLSGIYLLTAIITEFVSNVGAAAIMVPIALATAAEGGWAPSPFVFAVAFAASASFSTPIGYQTNTFVYGPGGYRFSDFVRVGLPLQVLLWIYASLAIPVFFPF